MGIKFAELCDRAEEMGMGVSAIDVGHLAELEREYTAASRRSSQEIAQYLAGFEFKVPGEIPDAKSILIFALPQPIIHLYFQWKGQRHEVILPPTYVTMKEENKVNDLAEATLGCSGYRWVQARLPRKFLAAKSGLASYGINNIAYISGKGSFFRLAVFYTDLACPDGLLEGIRSLERCGECLACQRNCPTGSLRHGRAMIDAGRCLTYLNERQEDFPDWVRPEWHHALVGCMRCQEVCPENSHVIGNKLEYASFTEEETRAILTMSFADLATAISERLTAFCGSDDYPCFVRNLGLLLGAS